MPTTKQTLTIEEVLQEYQAKRDALQEETAITQSIRGQLVAVELVVTDCLELSIMAYYRKASKVRQKVCLQRAIDCYNGSYPTQDDYSTAARTVLQEAATKLAQVKI